MGRIPIPVTVTWRFASELSWVPDEGTFIWASFFLSRQERSEQCRGFFRHWLWQNVCSGDKELALFCPLSYDFGHRFRGGYVCVGL